MKRIVIFRLSALGDVAMLVPVVRAFTEQYKDIHVTVASRAFCEPLFEGIDNVDFFSVDTKVKYKGGLGIFKLYKDLKKLGVDCFLDFHDVLRSKIIRVLFRLSGVDVYITDKGRKEKKALTRYSNKIFIPLKSMVQRHFDTLAKSGYQIDVTKLNFPEKLEVPSQITYSVKKRVGIAPFAQHQTKVYPIELMKEVVKKLSDAYQVFLFGSKLELDELKSISGQSLDVCILAGKMSFKEELQLIQNLDLMVSMDSANGHLAAMYGVPVITVWGNTHPYAGFKPFDQPCHNQITPNIEEFPLLPTSIYGNKKVEGYLDVMRSIHPNRIIDKVRTILGT